MNKISRFRFYRSKGFRWRMAWYCADLPRQQAVLDFLERLAIAAVVVLMLLCLTAWLDGHYEAEASATVIKAQSEASALRGIVAQCLGEKEGTIFIGDELHLCRAVPTGEKR